MAKLTVRRQVARAADVATGNGVQALLASRHAGVVVATDVNTRALDFAAINAELNDVRNIELRHGSYFEPLAGDRFDLITCNPPYVISPETRSVYRDSGLPGDSACRHLVQNAPEHLNEGGFAQILVSWGHRGEDWRGPVARWVEGGGCDAWLLHFGSDDPVTHAAEWLRPVARDPDDFRTRLARWLHYLAELQIEAIAHGAVILRRRTADSNWLRSDHVSLDRLEQASEHILRVFEAQDYLSSLDDVRQLLEGRFALTPDHQLEQTLIVEGGSSRLERTTLSLDGGLAFRVGVDLDAAQLLPLLDGRRPLRQLLAERASALGVGDERFEAAALPVVRRLLELGAISPVAD